MHRLLLTSLLALAVFAPAAQAYPHASGAAVRHNPANSARLLRTPIEDPVYDPATHCAGRTRPGMVRLERWLSHHVRGVFWGSYRCEKWGKHSRGAWASRRSSGTAATGAPG